MKKQKAWAMESAEECAVALALAIGLLEQAEAHGLAGVYMDPDEDGVEFRATSAQIATMVEAVIAWLHRSEQAA